MRLIKVVAGACILAALGSALAGCVVVPVPYWHGGGGFYHERR